jgi:hypothetical protein
MVARETPHICTISALVYCPQHSCSYVLGIRLHTLILARGFILLYTAGVTEPLAHYRNPRNQKEREDRESPTAES